MTPGSGKEHLPPKAAWWGGGDGGSR